MVAAQDLKATHDVGDHVQRVDDKVQQVVDGISYQGCSSSNSITSLAMKAYRLSQGTSYEIALETGSLLQIHL